MRFSHEKLGLEKTHIDKIGLDGFKLRKPELQELAKYEEYIRSVAPLPCSYDVTAAQPNYFKEFTYTEHCMGLYLRPQSVEVGCRIMHEAVRNTDISGDMAKRLDETWGKFTDKYNLRDSITRKEAKRIVFLPGSNLIYSAISREILTRLMFENDDIYLKLHPLTDTRDVYKLGAEFGYHKLLPRKESGFEYLMQAEECWMASNSELATYAILSGSKLNNVSNFFWESRGAHYPIFQQYLKAYNPLDSLNKIFACEWSGLLNPLVHSESEIKNRIHEFFDVAMKLREDYKPLAAPFKETKYEVMREKQKKKEPNKMEDI